MLGNKSSATMKLFFVLCLCFGWTLENVVSGFKPYNNRLIRYTDRALFENYNTNDTDEEVIRLVEQQMLSLNKSGVVPRDKRALGIILQGFMEALGYTVSPLQIASLANPTPPTQMSGMALQPGRPAPGSAPPTMPNGTAAGPTPPPRQRETLRFTGVLNFGNNANTTNLVNHLAQYERLFHNPGSAGITPPSPAPMPSIDPRTLPPLPEPLFVKIPLPIVPNLPPPQPPSPMPVKINYENNYSLGHFEEYQGSKDDEGRRGEYEEEGDKSHHSEEYENNKERYNEPGDRQYEDDSYEKPDDKNTEKEYKNKQKVVNYSIENKDIYDPREVSADVPMTKTKFNHAVYVNEPDWKKNHQEHLYKLAAEQEAHAEALAEENAEREKDRNREDEDDKEFHDNRAKEISDHNDEQEAKYEANSKPKPYYNEEGVEEGNGEGEGEDDSGSSEKESYGDNRRETEDDPDDYQDESKNTPPNYSQNTTPPSENSEENEAITKKLTSKVRKPYSSEPSSGYNKNYDNFEKPSNQEKNEPTKYFPTLPISYDGQNFNRDQTLRDSYGESLEKPDGKVDERLSSYFTMFKNPETGIYDPSRIREYENSRTPYDHLDLINGFKRIEKEYGSPENKYEEYELSDEKDQQVEHREKSNFRKPLTKDYGGERSENESRKNVKKIHPEIKECDCNTQKGDGQSEEARTHGKAVTAGLLPSRISESPKNYGPFDPTAKYLLDPLDYDQSIIASLTSHNPSTTTQFENTVKYVESPSNTVSYHQTSNLPTEAAMIDKITDKSLPSETETIGMRARPAPFDYAFDTTQNNLALKKMAKTGLKEAPTNNNPVTTHQTPDGTTRSNCHQDDYSLAPKEFAIKVKKLLRDHENDKFAVDNRNKRQRQLVRPSALSRLKIPKQQIARNGHYSSHPPTSTTTSFEKGLRRQSGGERSGIYQERSRVPTFNPMETRTPHQERFWVTKNSTPSRKVVRLEEEARKPKEQQVMRAKSTAKKKYSSYPPVNTKSSKDESSNYVEKDGMLIIPEPTPYYFNERIEEFVEDPKSDTEKVKIKQYRNRIDSIKISNLKQLHPIGTTHILKYTRNL